MGCAVQVARADHDREWHGGVVTAVSVVVAGGGTAGHIEPAMALADAVRRLKSDARITALGTE
jgi:NADH dehydrogenase FAD-containing subunit